MKELSGAARPKCAESTPLVRLDANRSHANQEFFRGSSAEFLRRSLDHSLAALENEVGGAKLVQERDGAHVVIGGGDWDMVDQSAKWFPNGNPKRESCRCRRHADRSRRQNGQPVSDARPYAGTISGIFQAHDEGKPLTVAYSGGAQFDLVNVPHF